MSQIIFCCWKDFYLILKKPVTRENWDKLRVNFVIFEWWNWSKHQFCQIFKCQMAFFGITVNFITQKLKSKHLVCLSFLWWQVFFEGTRENIFHIFRVSVLWVGQCLRIVPKIVHKSTKNCPQKPKKLSPKMS